MAAKRHGYGARPSGGRRGSRGLFENSSDSSRAHRAGFNDAHIVDEIFFLRFAQFFGTFPSFSNVGGVKWPSLTARISAHTPPLTILRPAMDSARRGLFNGVLHAKFRETFFLGRNPYTCSRVKRNGADDSLELTTE